jgi:hypothetical protein
VSTGTKRSPTRRINEHSVAPHPNLRAWSSDGLLLFSRPCYHRLPTPGPGPESGYPRPGAFRIPGTKARGCCVASAGGLRAALVVPVSRWPARLRQWTVPATAASTAVIAASRARHRQRKRLAARRCCGSACLRCRTISRLSWSSRPLIGPSCDRDVRRIASGALTAVIAGPDT